MPKIEIKIDEPELQQLIKILTENGISNLSIDSLKRSDEILKYPHYFHEDIPKEITSDLITGIAAGIYIACERYKDLPCPYTDTFHSKQLGNFVFQINKKEKTIKCAKLVSN